MLRLEHLHELAESFPDLLESPVREFSLNGRLLAFNTRPALMGVVNLSPDSWYRESVCLTSEAALERGKLLALQGAELIDVGAESSLERAERAGALLQQARLLPVVRGLAQAGLLVSVETYDPSVARAALEAGAKVINLTGTASSSEIYALARDFEAAVIICYVQGPNVREVGDFELPADPIPAMTEYFERQTARALDAGLDRILLDPGLGFYYRNLMDNAVRVRFQMRVFLHGFRLRRLGFPVCQALPHAFEYFGAEVRSAEPFFAVLAALGQTSLFRTHEVAKTRAVLQTLLAY